jgi:hypothetical protein
VCEGPGTTEEKLNIMEEQWKQFHGSTTDGMREVFAKDPPFSRERELKRLQGKEVAPFVAYNGEEFSTLRSKDKRNKELLRAIQVNGGEFPADLFPWMYSDNGAEPNYEMTEHVAEDGVYSNGVLIGSRPSQSFAELFAEARQELELPSRRPNRFVRIYRAIREAIR